MAKTKKILSYVCALLMICMFVLQFVPVDNWSHDVRVKDGDTYIEYTEKLSINEYFWLKANNTPAKMHLQSIAPGFDINKTVLVPFLMFFLCIVGAVFCIIKPNVGGMALMPLAAGIIGVVGYLTMPLLNTINLWAVYFGVSVAMVIVALAALILNVINSKKKTDKTAGELIFIIIGLIIGVAVVAGVILTLVFVVLPMGKTLKTIPTICAVAICIVIGVVIYLFNRSAKKKREKALTAWVESRK